MRKATEITLSTKQRNELEALTKGRRTETRVAERAEIVLMAAEGKRNDEIGAAFEFWGHLT